MELIEETDNFINSMDNSNDYSNDFQKEQGNKIDKVLTKDIADKSNNYVPDESEQQLHNKLLTQANFFKNQDVNETQDIQLRTNEEFKNLYDEVNETNEIEELIQSPEYLEQGKKKNETKLNLIQKKERKDMKQIFGNFIVESELSILFGDTNLGKSILGLQIAIGVAKGSKVLGLNNETSTKNILYFDLELNEIQIQKRIDGIDIPDNIDYILLETFNKDKKEANIDSIISYINDYNPDFIIIDNLQCITQNDISKFKMEVKRIIEPLKQLTSQGKTVLLINHTNKFTKYKPLNRDDMLGSGVLRNYADNIFGIAQSKQASDLRYIKPLKVRSYEYNSNEIVIMKLSSKPILEFQFNGLDEELNHLLKEEAPKPQIDYKQICNDVIGNDELQHNEIVEKLKEKYKLSESNAKYYISKFIDCKFIIKTEKTYKLNSSKYF